MKNKMILGKLYLAREAINTLKNAIGALIVSFENVEKLDNEIKSKEIQLIELNRKISEIKVGIKMDGLTYLDKDWHIYEGIFYVDGRKEKILIKHENVVKIFCLNKFYIDYENEFIDYKRKKNENN